MTKNKEVKSWEEKVKQYISSVYLAHEEPHSYSSMEKYGIDLVKDLLKKQAEESMRQKHKNDKYLSHILKEKLRMQAEEIEKGLSLLVLAYPELKVAIKSVLYDQNKIKSTVLEEK